MKRKISVITGSRSEYGILRPVLQEIKASKKLELYLIVTGMHLSKKHGMTIKEIKKDGFRIHGTFNMVPKGDTPFFMSKALGEGIIKLSEIFQKLQPDINLVLGDRTEALASALAACHMNIPNAHIHGGDRSKAGIDEYARHAITKISNIHFAATKKSEERILKLGEDSKYVFLTGSPSIDEIANYKITGKSDLEKKYGIKFRGDEILLLYHPITTDIKNTKKEILNILKAIVKHQKTVIAIAPNSDAGNKIIFHNLNSFAKKFSFKLYKNLPRSDYLGMLKNIGVLVGNSSSGIIEASYLNIPVVNVGIRQKDRERGKNVVDVENTVDRLIYNAIDNAMRLKVKKSCIYGDGKSSKKIVKHLENIKLSKQLIQKQISY